MAYDDARATGTMAFPNARYESVVRFQLPDGEHQPVRLRFQAEAPGSLRSPSTTARYWRRPGDRFTR